MFNTPENQWPHALEGWRELGATHLTLNTMNAKLASPQGHLDAIRRLIEMARS
jgi:hypothetical protein